MLEAKNIACGYGKNNIIENVSFAVKPGQVLCILGPNGAGKTTLFKALLGLNDLSAGSVSYAGKDLTGCSRAERAKIMGYIPQSHNPPFPYRVIDIVLMGRTAHVGLFAKPAAADMEVAEEALTRLQLTDKRDKTYTELSGGERQLVLIARALAQQPKILIMDEPTSNLDFSNQFLVLKQIESLAAGGLTIIMSSHFPNHAFHYATDVLLLKKGRVFKIGPPDSTMTEDSLLATYGIKVKIAAVNLNCGEQIKICVPLSI